MRRLSRSTLATLAVGLAAGSLAPSHAVAQVFVQPGVVSRLVRPVPPAPPAVIVGQVVDASTGRAIPRAIVHVGGPDTDVTRLTDDRGRFFVVGLHGGNYAISAGKAGYFDGAFDQRRVEGAGRPVALADHQWITDVQVALWRPAVLAGTIIDEAGEPMVGVRVDVLRKTFENGAAQLEPFGWEITDDHGEYRFAKLLPGAFVISVPMHVASVPTAVAMNMTDSLGQKSDALPEAFFSAGAGRLDLSASQLILADMWNPPRPAISTPPMTYQTTYFASTPVASNAQSVTLASGEIRTGVDIQMMPVPRGAISGTVSGPAGPLAGAALRLLVAGEDDPGFQGEVAVTSSATDGQFLFPEVPFGQYVIEAPGLSSIDMSAQISDGNADPPQITGPVVATIAHSRPTPGSRAMSGRARVNLSSASVTDVRLTLEPDATVTGLVLFEGTTAVAPDHPSQFVSIDFLPVGGHADLARHAFFDNGITFTVGLARDEYFAHLGPPPPGWYVKSITGGGRDLLSTPLDLTSSGDIADLVVTFTDTPTEIVGVVYDGRRAPVGIASIVVFPAESSYRGVAALEPDRERVFRTDPSGIFDIRGLPPGSYFLAAIDEAAADGWQDPRRLEALRASAARVTIGAGEQRHQDLTFTTKR